MKIVICLEFGNWDLAFCSSMLEDIIISKVRVKLLVLFLRNPGTMYHVREITRQIDEEINAVRRELAHMEEAQMVESEWRQNRRYYQFKKDYPLYQELLALVIKTSGLGGAIIANKARLGKLKFAFVSHIFAKGQEPEQTDVDLFLVGPVALQELTILVKEEELKREREINYTAMSEEEFVFRRRRRDPFLISILEKPRIMLIGDEDALVKMI